MGLTKNDIYNNVTTDFTVGDHIRNTTDSVTTPPSLESDSQISTDVFPRSLLFNNPFSYDIRNGWDIISYPHPYRGNVLEQLYAAIFNTVAIPSPLDISIQLKPYIFTIKDNNGKAYLPEWNFNGIGDFIPGQGYLIRAKKDFTLSWPIFIRGSESEKTQFSNLYDTPEKYISELNSTTISLSEGWNIIGYNRFVERDVIEELTDPNGPNLTISTDLEVSDISIVKNNEGRAYIPEFEFNGVGKFFPGQGYQIKATRDINFNWTDALEADFQLPDGEPNIYLQSPQASTSDQNSINRF